MNKDANNLSVLYYRYPEKGRVEAVLEVCCAACGAKTAVSRKYGAPVNAPWTREAARREVFRKAAEEESLPSAEELAAEQAYKATLLSAEQANDRIMKLWAKLQETAGEVAVDRISGEYRTVGRDEELYAQGESLMTQAGAERDAAGQQVVQARQALEKLRQPRLRRIQQRFEELQQADARSRTAAGVKSGIATRLREVLGLQRRPTGQQMDTKIFELKRPRFEEGGFRAVFSTMGVIDRQGDLTLPGAFGRQEVLIGGYNHAAWDRGADALPIGIGTIYERGSEGIVEGEFDLKDDAAAKTYHKIKYLTDKGHVQEWSYSLPEIDYEYRDVDGQRARVLRKIWVNEVSPVLRGAGIDTRLLEVKGCENCCDPGHCRACANNRLRRAEDLRAELGRFKRIMARAELLRRCGYVPVDEGLVLDRWPNVAAAADVALGFMAEALGIPWPMKILWIRPENSAEGAYIRRYGCRDWEAYTYDEPVCGSTVRLSDKIMVLAGMSPRDTLLTIGHELAHILQPADMDLEHKQAEADRTAALLLAEFETEMRGLRPARFGR